MKQIQTNQTFTRKKLLRLINNAKARPVGMKPARARKLIFLYPPGRYVPVQRYENFYQTQKLRNLKFAYNKETQLLSHSKAVFLPDVQYITRQKIWPNRAVSVSLAASHAYAR